MKNPFPEPLRKLSLFSLGSVQMRTFHITWLMFFVCFFGWFGLAPLMPTIREDLGLTKSQVGNVMIASVSGTILARLLIGRLCDTWGPRKTAVRLLLAGSVPVFFCGLAHDYTTFLLFRLAIGTIGASFVITQFHTSIMFHASLKGTANALTGGWGNLGGGVTNIVMPLIFAVIMGFGYTAGESWRLAMIVPGLMMLGVAFLYHRYTKDTPAGNYDEIQRDVADNIADWSVLKDWRLWALMLAYAMCFGMEITFDNVASLHFVDTYHLSQATAGLLAGTFGLMNLFARGLGGFVSDRIGLKQGIRGKGLLLAFVLMAEGGGLLLFAGAPSLQLAIVAMIGFALFLKMANGATYGIVPFISPRNVGLVSGIVGAGGNIGGMLFGFLFKAENVSYEQAFSWIAYAVIATGCIILFTAFSKESSERRVPNLIPQ